jgi:hypothetical protein
MLALQRTPPVRSNLHSARAERTSGGSNVIEVFDRVLDIAAAEIDHQHMSICAG